MDLEQAMRQIQAKARASCDELRKLQRQENRNKRKIKRRLDEAGQALVIVFVLTNESMKEARAFLSRWFADVSEHPRFSEQWVRQRLQELDEPTKMALQSGDKPPSVQGSTYRKVQKFMADLDLWKGVRDVKNRAGVAVGVKKVQDLLAAATTPDQSRRQSGLRVGHRLH